MGRRYGAARPQENFLVLTTCTGRGRDAGNEAAGGAVGCVLRVRVLKPKVGRWRVGWGWGGAGPRAQESSTIGVSELEEERRRTRSGRHLEMFPELSAGRSNRRSKVRLTKRPQTVGFTFTCTSFVRHKAEKGMLTDRSDLVCPRFVQVQRPSVQLLEGSTCMKCKKKNILIVCFKLEKFQKHLLCFHFLRKVILIR